MSHIKKGKKRTKVGITPLNWQKLEISNLFDISLKKFNPKTSVENKKCIELEHISQNTGLLLGFFDSKEQKSTKNIFMRGEVLYGKLRPYLRKYWKAEFDGVCSTELWVLKGKKLTNEYLFQFVQTDMFNQIANITIGTKMPRADWKYMSEIPFNIPPLKEQKKIAKILTAWSNAISKQEELIKVRQENKKGLMQKLLSGEIRFDGFNAKWKKVKLGEILKISSGKDYKHLETGEIPVFGTGGYMLSVNKYLYDGESACIGRKGTIDKPMLLNGKFWTIDTLFYTHSYKNTIPKFVYAVFTKINWKYYNESTGIPSLLKNTIKNIKIKLPPLKEQQQIAEVLILAEQTIELLKSELIELKEQKKALMQKLLTGEIRVKV